MVTDNKDIIDILTTNVRKGYYVLLKSIPCKVTGMRTTKRSMFSARKSSIKFTGLDILTGKVYEESYYVNQMMKCVNVKINQYIVGDVDNKTGNLLLLDEKYNEQFNITLDLLKLNWNGQEDKPIEHALYDAFNSTLETDELVIDTIIILGKMHIERYYRQKLM